MDEFEQIPVRISRIDTLADRVATVRPLTLLDDLRVGTRQHFGKRCVRALPHPAEVTSGRLGRRRVEHKRPALPKERAVKVDLLIGEVDGNDSPTVSHDEPERTVEGYHLLHVLDRNRHVIESPNP
jgi:hypothetical protein